MLKGGLEIVEMGEWKREFGVEEPDGIWCHCFERGYEAVSHHEHIGDSAPDIVDSSSLRRRCTKEEGAFEIQIIKEKQFIWLTFWLSI